MDETASLRTDLPPLRLGSEEHKEAFCRMLLDTHDPYKPAIMEWPRLEGDALARLTSLPIWDIAVATEGQAALNVQAYAEQLSDPLLEEAVTLDAFEERRHKEVLAHMVRFYGIDLAPEPEYDHPADGEWAFMRTGYAECLDSFFAFGLFEMAKRSGFFPEALVDTFEPVIQEECRHILFFVNWVSWRRRTLPWWRKPAFLLRCAGALIHQVWGRVNTARNVGGGENFTVQGHHSLAREDLSARDLIDICLAENDRRMAMLDPRLPRPRLVPALAHFVRLFLGRPRPA
jgi:hypothetical protein